jgi:hypothetical protein
MRLMRRMFSLRAAVETLSTAASSARLYGGVNRYREIARGSLS